MIVDKKSALVFVVLMFGCNRSAIVANSATYVLPTTGQVEKKVHPRF